MAKSMSTATSTEEVRQKFISLSYKEPNSSSKKKSVYIIPLNKVPLANGVAKCDIIPDGKEQSIVQEKVIMMVGGTGTGKSTLINRMINHILGVEYEDDYRFQLIVEDEAKSQVISQTKTITVYTIHKTSLPFSLTIIDTPGFGDTGGKDEDKKTFALIKELFESGRIKTLDAITFVAKFNNVRLTPGQKYVFQSVVKIFGKDVKDIIFICATFCDTDEEDDDDNEDKNEEPPVLKAIRSENIPLKTFLRFNNDKMYAKTKSHLTKIFWEMSKNSFLQFFGFELNETLPISLTLTKDVLQKRENIQSAQLPALVRKLNTGSHEIQLLKRERETIEMFEKQINENQSFTYVETRTVPMLTQIRQPGIFVSRCQKCNYECHYPCNIAPSGSLRWCGAMSKFNLKFSIHCSVCRGKCSWKDHVSSDKVLANVTVTETRTHEHLKQKYETAKVNKNKKEGMLEESKRKVTKAYGDMLETFEEMQGCINFVNENSLSKLPVSMENYVSEMVEEEKQVKQDGYQERIECYNKLIIIKKQSKHIAFRKATSAGKTEQAIQFLDS